MARIKVVSSDEQKKVQRGWGHELWIENLPDYCGKVLMLEQGKRSSLHFHLNKLETMYLAKGAVRLLLIDPETGKEYEESLFPGDSIKIPRGQVHQIIADRHSELIEFSTTHEESDSYRVKKGD